MTATPKFPGTIKSGKPMLDNLHKYRAYLAGFKEGTRIELVLRKQTKRRTDPQNRYYFGVVVPMLGEHFGYTKDETHEALKWLFLQKPDANPPTVGSTAKLDTQGFNAYIEQIQAWAAQEHGVIVPDPDEVDY